MFDRYVPDPIDRHLAAIYLVAAMLVFLAPLSALKWIPIAALMIAAGLTLLLRHTPDRRAQAGKGQVDHHRRRRFGSDQRPRRVSRRGKGRALLERALRAVLPPAVR